MCCIIGHIGDRVLYYWTNVGKVLIYWTIVKLAFSINQKLQPPNQEPPNQKLLIRSPL